MPGDDPHAHDDRRLGPAAHLEMMVERALQEQTLAAGELEVASCRITDPDDDEDARDDDDGSSVRERIAMRR
jgi:hypothetical protein